MKPTDEQSVAVEATKSTKSNLIIRSYAGTGKTSTLEMLERALPRQPILYLVFNKKNAEEAEERMLSTTQVRTMNSIGHRIWAKSIAKNQLSLKPSKTGDLLRELIKASPKSAQGEMWNSYWEIIHGVGLAKSLGYIPDGKYEHVKRIISRAEFHRELDEQPDDLTADLIDEMLVQSIKLAYQGTIDYNDQVYMPAMFGGTFPQFPLVLVDELQDLSPTNHAMLARLAKGRLIGVGDPCQSIYVFRGAVEGGMDRVRERFNCTELSLSISFRCPRAIVEHVQWRVPEFKWIKEGGDVRIRNDLHHSEIEDDSVIISRNNAPLLRFAFRALASGRSVQVAGSDIGPKLVALLKKLGPESLSKNQALSAIEDWREEKLSKESASANDLADCMAVFCEHGETLGQAISYAEHIFKQKGALRLMTGHKSKGLEFNNVIHLDPWLVRGRGSQPPSDQDQNLDYVISTRSADQLTEIDSDRIQW